jgi:hypothetical protein
LGNPTSASAPFSPIQPNSTFTNNSNSYWSIEPQVNYNREIAKGKLSVIFGSSLQENIDESTQVKETGYSSDLLLRSISAGITTAYIQPYSYSPYKLSRLFGRISYNWDIKYMGRLKWS